MKSLFPFILLILTGCSNSTVLTDNEQMLVGSWRKSDDGDGIVEYIELHDDRTGVRGFGFSNEGKVKFQYALSFIIKNWQIQNDSLVIQSTTRSGVVATGPDGKEIKAPGKVTTSNYIIKEVTEDTIVLEDLLTAGSPTGASTDRYLKSEKIKVDEE